ncbi:hypothetical protein [Viridibacillus arvi]|uniref:hypothetical protein n=1 Tax=Viridibacillus arvi TaxID=263475 RepID=UPI0036A80628
MSEGFKHLFIGYLFLLINIYIVVDIMPNFIGYILISSGIAKIAAEGKETMRAQLLAILLAVYSLPHFFLQDQVRASYNWGEYYDLSYGLLQVIQVYFLFVVIQSVFTSLAAVKLSKITNKIGIWYLSIHLLSLFTMTLIINTLGMLQVTFLFIMSALPLIINIVFIIYLRKMQKRTVKSIAIDNLV